MIKEEGIIFDLDGTLWNSIYAICDTWNMILSRYPEVREPITVDELEPCMGLFLDDISKRLFPKQSPQVRKKLIDLCCREECVYLAEHGGRLYENVEETLKKLSENHRLFIVSNCQDGYIQSFFSGHGLRRYFKDFECNGRTGLSKGENNKLIINRNGLKSSIYVGDTITDKISADYAGIPFVFAKYGFGNTDEYDYCIERFDDLLKL